MFKYFLMYAIILFDCAYSFASPKPVNTPTSSIPSINAKPVSTPIPVLNNTTNSNPRPIYPPDIQRIKDRGEFVVCQYNQERAPFFMRNPKGEVVGLDVDISKGLAKGLGVKLRIQLVNSFNAVVDGVINGKCDAGISKLSLTGPRSQKVLYTRPYVMAQKVLLINRVALQKYQRKADKSLEEIIKKDRPLIYVEANSSYVEFAKTLLPEARLKTYTSWPHEAVPNVYNGKVFAAFTDEFDTWEVLQSIPDAPLKLLVVTLKKQYDPLYMITAWDNYNLREYMQSYTDLQSINYTAQTAIDKYKSDVNLYIEQAKVRWQSAFADNKK